MARLRGANEASWSHRRRSILRFRVNSHAVRRRCVHVSAAAECSSCPCVLAQVMKGQLDERLNEVANLQVALGQLSAEVRTVTMCLSCRAPGAACCQAR